MAKTISVNVEHEYTSRGETMSVKEALAWVEEHMSDDDGNVKYGPADLLVYGVRRLMALHSDGKRYAAGKLASRFYAPRIDNLSDKVKAPRKVVQGAALIHEAAPEPSEPSKPSKPAAKPEGKRTPVKVAPVKLPPPAPVKAASK